MNSRAFCSASWRPNENWLATPFWVLCWKRYFRGCIFQKVCKNIQSHEEKNVLIYKSAHIFICVFNVFILIVVVL